MACGHVAVSSTANRYTDTPIERKIILQTGTLSRISHACPVLYFTLKVFFALSFKILSWHGKIAYRRIYFTPKPRATK